VRFSTIDRTGEHRGRVAQHHWRSRSRITRWRGRWVPHPADSSGSSGGVVTLRTWQPLSPWGSCGEYGALPASTLRTQSRWRFRDRRLPWFRSRTPWPAPLALRMGCRCSVAGPRDRRLHGPRNFRGDHRVRRGQDLRNNPSHPKGGLQQGRQNRRSGQGRRRLPLALPGQWTCQLLKPRQSWDRMDGHDSHRRSRRPHGRMKQHPQRPISAALGGCRGRCSKCIHSCPTGHCGCLHCQPRRQSRPCSHCRTGGQRACGPHSTPTRAHLSGLQQCCWNERPACNCCGTGLAPKTPTSTVASATRFRCGCAVPCTLHNRHSRVIHFGVGDRSTHWKT
jgi:hypothetical protein